MKRVAASLVVVAMSTAVATAQPASSYPPATTYPPTNPSSYPPPASTYVPPTATYQPSNRPPQPVQLTLDEQWLLERGYISEGARIGGGFAAIFVGYGVGQAIQGRWTRDGWPFLIGDGITSLLESYYLMAMLVCAIDRDDGDPTDHRCNTDYYERRALWTLLAIGIIRTWEAVDAFTVPTAHNRKLRELRVRTGMEPMYSRLMPTLGPTRNGEGAMAGLSISF